MKKKSEPPKFSETISGTIEMLDDAISDYNWNYDEVGRLDRLTQDYLHKLELSDLNYGGRAKLATQIKKCRMERRACKDTTEILDPLVQFLESEKGKNMMNLLREVLGKTRKAEEWMENRTYRPRVLPDKEFNEK
jgi:hypothetical protein